MNRQALASEAIRVSQSILATVPVRIRIASIAHSFLKQAFTQADMLLSIGLQALVSMEAAGTPGDIEGKTIDELRPFIKANALSKIKGAANAIGGKIFRLSYAGKHALPLPQLEEAWNNYTGMLQRLPLSSDKNVGQAIHYMANGFSLRIKDVIDNDIRRRDIRKNPEVGETMHRDHERRPDEVALWSQIERKFKGNPLLLGPKGEPWAWLYVEGKAGGMTEEQIIASWNQASRKDGGTSAPLETRSTFLSWLKHPPRKALMQQLTKSYLDEEVLKKLKLAAARGALRTAYLLPFERDLLGLLI